MRIEGTCKTLGVQQENIDSCLKKSNPRVRLVTELNNQYEFCEIGKSQD